MSKTGLIALILLAALFQLEGQQSHVTKQDSLIQPSAREVITNFCIRCHSGANPPKGVILTDLDLIRKELTPGDSSKSRLFLALVGVSYQQMPPFYPLSWRNINSVRRWIDSGATLAGFDERAQFVLMGGTEPIVPDQEVQGEVKK